MIAKVESDNESKGGEVTDPRVQRRKRAARNMFICAALIVVVTGLFWRSTWFGLTLTDEQIEQYLTQTEKRRKTQHALVQLSDRISSGDTSARKFYPQIVSLATHADPALRSTVAWVMGEDNTSEVFREVLHQMLTDDEPLVRQNAALALSRFQDESARNVLLAMLQPHVVTADLAGTVKALLEKGEPVAHDGRLALLDTGQGDPNEIPSPLPGRIERTMVKVGDKVLPGEQLCAIAPTAEQVFQALRALYIVGQPQDLPEVERYAQASPAIPPKVQQQAQLTAAAIRQRADHPEKRAGADP